MAHTCMAQCECTGYLTVYNDARHGYRTRVAAARLPYKLYDTTVPSSSVVALVPPPPPGARPRRARLAPPTCNNISEVAVEASHAAVNCCPTPKCSPPRPPPYIKPLRTCMCRRTPSPPASGGFHALCIAHGPRATLEWSGLRRVARLRPRATSALNARVAPTAHSTRIWHPPLGAPAARCLLPRLAFGLCGPRSKYARRCARQRK